MAGRIDLPTLVQQVRVDVSSANRAERLVQRFGRTLQDAFRQADRDTDQLSDSLREVSDSTRDVERSSSRTSRALGTFIRTVRDARREVDRTVEANSSAGGSFRNLGDTVLRTEDGFVRIGAGVKLFGGTLIALASAVEPAISALTALGAGAVALVGGLGPAAGSLASFPIMLGAFASGLALVKASTKGLGEAATAIADFGEGSREAEDALRDLNPAAREFTRTLAQYVVAGRDLRAVAQQTALPGMNEGLRRAQPILQVVRDSTAALGVEVGSLTTKLGTLAGSYHFLKDMRQVGGANAVVFRNMGDGLTALVSLMRHVAVAAGPMTVALSASMAGFLEQVNALAGNNRGRLTAFFERAGTAATNLGSALGDTSVALFKIFSTASMAFGGSGGITGMIQDAAASFRAWTSINQRPIMEFFLQMRPAVREIGGLVADVGRALGALAVDPNTVANLQGLRKIIPDIAIALDRLGDFFPSIVSLVDALASSLATIDPTPLVELVELAAKFAQALATVVVENPWIGSALGAMAAALVFVKALAAIGTAAVTLKAALSGLGPLLAVVGVAAGAGALMRWSASAQVAKVSTDDLVESLKDVTTATADAGALGQVFSRGMGIFRKEAETMGEALDRFALSAQEAFGQNMTDKIDRWTSGGGKLATFNEQVTQLDTAMAEMVRSGNVDQAKDSYDQFIAAVEKANEAGANIPIEEVKGKFTEYKEAVDGARAASAMSISSTENLGYALQGTGDAATEARGKIDDLVQSMADAGLIQLDARAATRQFEQAIDDAADAAEKLTGHLNKSKDGFDLNTQAGRDAEAALDDVASAAIRQAQAVYKSTGNEAQFRQSLANSRQALYDTAIRLGLSEAAANRYADEILSIPATKQTVFSTPGLNGAIEGARILRSSLAQIGDKTVRVNTIYSTTGQRSASAHNAQGLATGGRVRGPGTGTSDTAGLFRLSNGEHVITAAEVRAAGGHDAIERLRKAILQRRFRGLAGGGRIGDTAAVARATPLLKQSGTASISSSGSLLSPVFNVRVMIGERDITDIVDFRIEEQLDGAALGVSLGSL